MLSNRGVLGLSVGIILLGFIYNYCTLECMLQALGYLSVFLRDRLGIETNWSSSTPTSRVVPTTTPAVHKKTGERLFTVQELSRYDGSEGLLYLALLGVVYDVQTGSKHYAKGAAYHHFVGRDASRAFITGDFTESGLRSDVLDLRPDDLLALEKWTKVYEKDYTVVGKLIGQYYDENGQPTDYLREVQKATAAAHKVEKVKEDKKKIFPPCNSEWLQDTGGRVWCTTMSGGYNRPWAGVPRQLFEPETGATRCACVRETELDNPNIKEFPNCPKDSESCATV